MNHPRRSISPLILFSALFLAVPPLPAQEAGSECASDADCAEGGICQKNSWTNGCAASPDGVEDCDTATHEAETGVCYVPPEECESDTECGEYLSCVEQNTGSCTSSPGGETTCTEDKGPSYCGVSQVMCETDSDCPRSFECVEQETVCLDIACPEDQPDCGACTSSGEMECRPMQLDCESDSECPSDWSCFDTVRYDCPDQEGDTASGGGEGGSTGSADKEDELAPSPETTEGDSDTQPAEKADAEEKDVPVCVAIPVVGSCYPDAWGSTDLFEGEDGSAEIDSSAGDPISGEDRGSDEDEKAATASSDGVGCSQVPTSPRSSGWLFALLLAIPAIRRRLSTL